MWTFNDNMDYQLTKIASNIIMPRMPSRVSKKNETRRVITIMSTSSEGDYQYHYEDQDHDEDQDHCRDQDE